MAHEMVGLSVQIPDEFTRARTLARVNPGANMSPANGLAICCLPWMLHVGDHVKDLDAQKCACKCATRGGQTYTHPSVACKHLPTAMVFVLCLPISKLVQPVLWTT